MGGGGDYEIDIVTPHGRLPIGGRPNPWEIPRQLLGASLLNVAANRDGAVERRGALAADETAADDGAS